MENKDIDNFFKSRSHTFNEMPSDDLWKKIENNLTQAPKPKFNFKKPLFSMALPFIVIISATTLYLNSNDNSIKNKTVSIQDSIKKEITTPKKDSNTLLLPKLKPTKTETSVSTNSITKKDAIKQYKTQSIIPSDEADITQEKIYSLDEVHIKPDYPGSINKLYEFINKKFELPKNCPGGRVTLKFIVEKDGTLTDIQCIKDIGLGTGAEAIRVLKECRKWEPGKQDGKIVRVLYKLPITLPARTTPEDFSPVYNMAGINVQPNFIGGKQKLDEYIAHNFQTPTDCPKSRLFVSFIIEKDGSLSNIKIQKWFSPEDKELDPRIGKLLMTEAIRVLEKCPKWEPGEQNGEKVRVLNSIAINLNGSN